MIILNTPQNSEKWFEQRKGNIGGSRVSHVRVSKIANKTEILAIVNPREFEGVNMEDKKEVAAKKKEVAALTQKQLEEKLTEKEYNNFFYKGMKKEYFRLLAEKMGYIDDPEEDPRDRGHRLEDEAADKLEEALNIKTHKVGMMIREDYNEIYVSPDRVIVKEGIVIDLDEEGYITNVQGSDIIGGVEIKSPGVANHLEIVLTNEVPSEYWDQVLQYFVVNEDQDYLYFISYNPLVIDRPLYFIRIDRVQVQKEVDESYEDQVNIIKHLREDVLSLAF